MMEFVCAVVSTCKSATFFNHFDFTLDRLDKTCKTVYTINWPGDLLSENNWYTKLFQTSCRQQ